MTLFHSPSVQSPAAYSNQNLAGNQLAARMAATPSAAQRLNLVTALGDTAWRYKIHPAETAAGLVDANLNFGVDPFDSRRYVGVDPSGATFSDTGLTNFFAAVANLGNGGEAYLFPGIYKIANTLSVQLTPGAGVNFETLGATIYAYGAVLNYTGASYAVDFISANTSALFHGPLLTVLGLSALGTASALGAFRTRSVSGVRWRDCFARGFTAGPAWTVLNDTSWSENCHWNGCGAVNCKSIIAFQRNGTGTNSFARTTVENMFGAGITDYWFDVGGFIAGVASQSCAVYDSVFRHISGNFGALALFGIGNSTNASDMTASVIDGLDYEINGSVALTFTGALIAGATSATLNAAFPFATGQYTVIFSDAETRAVTLTNGATTATWAGGLAGGVTANATIQQGVFHLRDYPQNAGVARRPTVVNLGTYALFNGSGNIPVWLSNVGAALAQPESIQVQPFSCWTQGQSFETLQSLNTLKPMATYDSQQVVVNLTGCTAAVTGRMNFYRVGHICFAILFDPLAGTSNTTAMTVTGIPAEFTPASTVFGMTMVTNNGNATIPATFQVAGTTITFSMASGAFNTYSAVGFTAAGTKGLSQGLILQWPLT